MFLLMTLYRNTDVNALTSKDVEAHTYIEETIL